MNAVPGEGTSGQFDFSSGALCLDFTNTVGDRPWLHKETLHGYPDLLRWSREAGVLGEREVLHLSRRAGRDRSTQAVGGSASPNDEAAEVFRQTLGLREALYRLFAALARSEQAAPADLAQLNRALAAASPHRRLQVDPSGRGGSFTWAWAGTIDDLNCFVWPIVVSAAELLTSPEVSHVRECASQTCSWLFVDRSRAHRRRWCDMKVCGNRHKARRHYARQRERRSGRDAGSRL